MKTTNKPTRNTYRLLIKQKTGFLKSIVDIDATTKDEAILNAIRYCKCKSTDIVSIKKKF